MAHKEISGKEELKYKIKFLDKVLSDIRNKNA